MKAAEERTRWQTADCAKAYIYPNNRERCAGILKIHEICEPPCPRKQTAMRYLAEHPEAGQNQAL